MNQAIKKILRSVLAVACVSVMLFAVACGEEANSSADSGKTSAEISQSQSAAPADSSSTEAEDSSAVIEDSSAAESDDSSAQSEDDSSSTEADDSSATEVDDSSSDETDDEEVNPNVPGGSDLEEREDEADPATSNYTNLVDVRVVIGTYDDGPRVDKVILGIPRSVESSALSGNPFTVRYANGNLGGTASYYLCDKNGNRLSDAATSKFVAVDYGTNKNSKTNPFTYNGGDGYNSWKDVGTTVVTFNNFRIGTGTYSGELTNTTKDYYVPSLDQWDITGKHTKDGVTINYATYAPNVPKGEKRPIIVWLHGQGEGFSSRNNVDVRTSLLGNKVTPLSTDPIQSYFDGAFVIAPQAPTMWMDTFEGTFPAGAYLDDSHSKYFDALSELLRTYAASDPKMDTSRIYVGGCSNGGWCTLEVVSRMGDFFAACYPVCAPYRRGHFTDENFANLVKVPMWIVSSNDDTTVNMNGGDGNQTVNVDGMAHSKRLYIDLLEAGKTDLYFSLFPNVTADGQSYMGHFSWIYVFRDEVKYVQSKPADGGHFGRTDYDPQSTLTAEYRGREVNMWQWLSTFTNNGKRVRPIFPEN